MQRTARGEVRGGGPPTSQAWDIEELARVGRRAAMRFLGRWGDPWMHREREDLAQETMLEAWRRWNTIRRVDRFEAFVRTIARRRRWHALRAAARRRLERLEDLEDGGDHVVDERCRVRTIRVRGEVLAVAPLVAELRRELSGLGSLDRLLVRGYYEGFSCSELADRYGLAEHCVKVRLHRARHRIRERLVRRVVGAGREPLIRGRENERKDR